MPDIVLDKEFPVPPGLIDVRQETLDDSIYHERAQGYYAPPAADGPPADPTDYYGATVTQQTATTSTDGTTTVDVTMDSTSTQTLETRVTAVGTV